MAKAPFDLEAYQNALDIDSVYGEKGYTTNERNSIRPTLDVNGIWGGYIGEGAKTVGLPPSRGINRNGNTTPTIAAQAAMASEGV